MEPQQPPSPPETLRLFGLRDALSVVARAEHDAGQRIVVAEVLVGQAPPLLELLLKQKETHGWKVDDNSLRRLRRIARVANEATAIVEGVLPLIANDLQIKGVRCLLIRYSWSLRHQARGVDGPGKAFHDFIRPISNLMRRAARSRASIVESYLDLKNRVAAIHTQLVVIPEGQPDEADYKSAANDSDSDSDSTSEDV